MALTTETSRSISDNISATSTDVNANIAAPAAARARALSPEAAILFDKSIIARPLATPSVGEIHVKKQGYYYRWVAARACGGQVYNQRRSMGFTNATTDDVDSLSSDIVATEGEIRAGDLILMKMPYERWAEHVKHNMVKAQMQQRMRGVYPKGQPSTDVFSDEKVERQSISQEAFSKSATPFIPSNPDAIIDGQSPAAVARAKAETHDIREKIAHSKES